MMKKLWTRRWFRYSVIGLPVLIVVLELLARFYFGLGDVPVYVEHPAYEYIYAPNQDVWRFGNHIQTNEHSMRSKPLSQKDKRRILLIGDSVINGGAHVDQDDLASTRLENALTKDYPGTRVLNISASSWGPDNAYAYVETHGHFDAQAIVLVFSSHDYNDNMHHRKVVGQHPMWPDSSPTLALTDGFSSYVWPEVKSWFGAEFDEYAYLQGHDDSPVNSGWDNFIRYCSENGLPLLVYVHAEQPEIKSAEYHMKGQRLLNKLERDSVAHISGLKDPIPGHGYRDKIHLNGEGQAALSERLLPHIQALIKSSDRLVD